MSTSTETDKKSLLLGFLEKYQSYLLFAALLAFGLRDWNGPDHFAITDDASAYLSATWAMLHNALRPQDITTLLRAPAYIFGVLLPNFILFESQGKEAVLDGVRWVQYVAWALNLTFMFALARTLFQDLSAKSRNILSWLCALIGFLYFPLMYHADNILTETTTTTFLLAGILLLLKKRPRWAGLLLSCALLHRSFLALHALLFASLLYYLYIQNFNLKAIFKPAGNAGISKETKQFFIFFAVPILIAQMLLNVIPHPQMGSVYFWQFLSSGGWPVFSRIPESFGNLELFKLVNLDNSNLWEGLQLLFQDPLKLSRYYFGNVTRLFFFPNNPYYDVFQPLPFLRVDSSGLFILHTVILLGLVGLIPKKRFSDQDLENIAIERRPIGKTWQFISPELQKPGLPVPGFIYGLLLVLAGWILLYAFTSVELRYMLPMLPILIVCSVCGWRQYFTYSMGRTLLQSILVATVAILLACLCIGASLPNSYFNYLYVTGFRKWPLSLSNVWFLSALMLFTYIQIMRTVNDVKWRRDAKLREFGRWLFPRNGRAYFIREVLLGLAFFMVFMWFHSMNAPMRGSFEELSYRSYQGQDIPVTADFWKRAASKNNEKKYATFLVTEILSLRDDPVYPLRIKIDGNELNNMPYSVVDLPQSLLHHTHLLGGKIKFERLRQYRYIRISAELLSKIEMAKKKKDWGFPGSIHVGLRSTPDTPYSVKMDLPETGSDQFWLPSPDWGTYSIYRALAMGDGRISIRLKTQHADSKQPRMRMMLIQLPEDDVKDGPFMFGHIRPKSEITGESSKALDRDFFVYY